MTENGTIVWFRQDLRLEDNPALIAAAAAGPVLPLYIEAFGEEREWRPGEASRWWLHQSLRSLGEALRRRGSRLILRSGESSIEELRKLCRESGLRRVVWNRRYEPTAVAREEEIKNALGQEGVETKSFNASVLFEPWKITTKLGTPYQVFTPYWKACLGLGEPSEPEPAPGELPCPGEWPASASLDDLELEPKIHWAGGFAEEWAPGEAGARRILEEFLERSLTNYPTGRDRPDQRSTSRLSPYLHFGEIGPRQVWHAVRERTAELASGGTKGAMPAAESYLRELGWREFAHQLLFHFPETAENPLRAKFRGFPWKTDENALSAWREGRTGYPIVDAGMRELWRTGWMHNRVRMIVGSFLVKDLMIHWIEGARWFWDTLVDADLANNTLGWQWTAGCGADAAPYFRVFNPVLQGEKFDPDGVYVRRWIPELAGVSAKWMHKPWKAPAAELLRAGVELGETYPMPLVDHAESRQRALEAYEHIRS